MIMTFNVYFFFLFLNNISSMVDIGVSEKKHTQKREGQETILYLHRK